MRLQRGNEVGAVACHQRVEEDGAENSGDEDDATEGAWREQMIQVYR